MACMDSSRAHFRYFRYFRYWLACLGALLLAACGQQDGNTSLETFSAQNPDPVIVDLPIAYIKRPLPLASSGLLAASDLLAPADFQPGAGLYLRERAAPSAVETNLTADLFAAGEAYDIKDLAVAADGQQLLFALRAPALADVNADQQPRWDIWSYSLRNKALFRVIAADAIAAAGDDISPDFLADGRIVFASNRQQRSRSLLLDDGKPQYSALLENGDETAFVLHVMDADGRNIEQISFNQSHDLAPTVLADGKILFLRWDHVANRNNLAFYQMNPDGSELEIVYGYHSQLTGTNGSEATFWHPAELPDGNLLASLRPRSGNGYGGDLVSIAIQHFTDLAQPINTPASASPGGSTTAQRSLALLPITTSAGSLHGQFNSAAPLFDGSQRLLVSWSQCRLQASQDLSVIVPCTESLLADPAYQSAPPLFGLWLLDPKAQTQLPIATPQEGQMVTEAAVLAPRPAPAYIPPLAPANADQQQLLADGLGVVQIRSVYDLGGVDTTANGISVLADPALTATLARPAHYLRLIKAVGIPDDTVRDFDNSAFGISRSQQMREILGYVPIEPDGSVAFAVPADLAFGLSIVDAAGQRISQRHNNWLHLRAGSTTTCNGCHTSASTIAHGRPAAEPPSINPGAATNGRHYPTTPADLVADLGETMAETYARVHGLRRPSVDLLNIDVWRAAPLPAVALRYADLQTPPPVSAACQQHWTSRCRIIINYPDHIAPLWDLPRAIADPADPTSSLNITCTHCHGDTDAAGSPRVPAAQLDLRNTASDMNDLQVTSYRELLANDQALVLDPTGVLITELVQATDNSGNLLFQLDGNGDLQLDSNNNPIPMLVTVNVARSMSTNGARSSVKFFNQFAPTGSHADWLSPAELRLLAEWLDIGGQYYNNPFAAPLN